MFELNGFFGLIILVLDIWAILKTIESNLTTEKKVLWIVVIIVLPVLGVALWYFLADARPR